MPDIELMGQCRSHRPDGSEAKVVGPLQSAIKVIARKGTCLSLWPNTESVMPHLWDSGGIGNVGMVNRHRQSVP